MVSECKKWISCFRLQLYLQRANSTTQSSPLFPSKISKGLPTCGALFRSLLIPLTIFPKRGAFFDRFTDHLPFSDKWFFSSTVAQTTFYFLISFSQKQQIHTSLAWNISTSLLFISAYFYSPPESPSSVRPNFAVCRWIFWKYFFSYVYSTAANRGLFWSLKNKLSVSFSIHFLCLIFRISSFSRSHFSIYVLVPPFQRFTRARYSCQCIFCSCANEACAAYRHNWRMCLWDLSLYHACASPSSTR